MQPITDYNAFFDEAKAAISEASSLKSQVSELESDREKTESSLEAKQKEVAADIKTTLEKRRKEIESRYDAQISDIKEKSRKVSAKREKAKNQGIKARIAEETAPLKTEIKSYKEQISAIFRTNKVPAICKSNLFYSLFYPSTLSEWLILIICFALAFFVIPCGLWKYVFKSESTLVLIIIYVVDVIVFMLPYVLISRATVSKYSDQIKQGREIRKLIRKAKAAIKKNKRAIVADKDDNKYNLSSYDDELAKLDQQMADTTMKKKDALSTFDNVTCNIISDEITANSAERIQELKSGLESIRIQLADAREKSSKASTDLSDKYEVYLGKEFLTEARIERLRSIMNTGTATNLQEAMAEYQRQSDI